MLSKTFVLFLMFLQSVGPSGQDIQQSPDQKVDEIVLRDPFTLKLKLQDGSKYEEHFDQTPYVKDGNVYIFPGENFGVNAITAGGEITGLTYVKNPANANVRLKFTEETGGGRTMMILVIESRLKQTLYLDAFMQIPNRNGSYKTSILPVIAGKSGFESWPHPITLLVLRNLRFTQKPRTP